MNAKIVPYTNHKKNGIKLFVADDYDSLSSKAASIIAGQINSKPEFVLGLATGTSPIGLYDELIRLNSEEKVDFSNVTTYNLDEYYPIEPTHVQSYRYFMNKHLFDHVNIDKKNTHVPGGNAKDISSECASYDKALETIGGVDIQVLGIGNNGHIGFNEPCKNFIRGTHVVELTESTIKANSRLFNSIDEVPKKAVSMGIQNIFTAKTIILVANGEGKAQAIKDTLEGEITPFCQASILQLHPNTIFIIDKEAASKLTDYKPM